MAGYGGYLDFPRGAGVIPDEEPVAPESQVIDSRMLRDLLFPNQPDVPLIPGTNVPERDPVAAPVAPQTAPPSAVPPASPLGRTVPWMAGGGTTRDIPIQQMGNMRSLDTRETSGGPAPNMANPPEGTAAWTPAAPGQAAAEVASGMRPRMDPLTQQAGEDARINAQIGIQKERDAAAQIEAQRAAQKAKQEQQATFVKPIQEILAQSRIDATSSDPATRAQGQAKVLQITPILQNILNRSQVGGPLLPGQSQTVSDEGKVSTTTKGPAERSPITNANQLPPPSAGLEWVQGIDATGRPTWRQNAIPKIEGPLDKLDTGLKEAAQATIDPRNPSRTLWDALIAEKRMPGPGDMPVLEKYIKEKAARATTAKTELVDIPALASSVADGQMGPSQLKGSFGIPIVAQIQSEVLKKYPKFNFQYAEANARWVTSTVNQRTISMIEGSLPRLTMLDEQLKEMPNADIPAINAIMRQVSIQMGKPEFTNFESNRNAIVQEINTALSGSATGSDMRIKIELENIQSSRSPAQLKGAIGNLREALLARIEPSMSPLYPIEVLRGEMSPQEYQGSLRKKYGGRAETAPAQGGGGGKPPAGPAPAGATHWSPTKGYLDAQGNPVGGR